MKFLHLLELKILFFIYIFMFYITLLQTISQIRILLNKFQIRFTSNLHDLQGTG